MNEHTFVTIQVHEPVFCSAKQRHESFLRVILKRAEVWRRQQKARRLLAQGYKGVEVAKMLSLSKSGVSWIKRQS